MLAPVYMLTSILRVISQVFAPKPKTQAVETFKLIKSIPIKKAAHMDSLRDYSYKRFFNYCRMIILPTATVPSEVTKVNRKVPAGIFFKLISLRMPG